MDPVSQGVLGSAISQSFSNKKEMVVASVLGFLAGMAADLDILIRSSQDTLLFLEYHRQFTHSLIFIPIGGLLCTLVVFKLPFLNMSFLNMSFKKIYKFTTLGYATHALLDSCTTYGTQLFWPFSDYRVAWNTVSIIDPLFTVPVLVFTGISLLKKNKTWARFALLYVFLYMTLGLFQRHRAEVLAASLANIRNHEVIRLEAKPSFANLLLWKTIYETKDYFYVDAIRVSIFSSKVYAGNKIRKLNLQKDFPWLNTNSTQYKDIKRFSWFSNAYVAKDPNKENYIIDVRYSIVPNEIDALWGIQLYPKVQNKHAFYSVHRSLDINKRSKFLRMLFGYDI